jgi:hypothetical protein
MSRYDHDFSPDDMRNNVTRPARESNGTVESFSIRGQGSGNSDHDAAQEQPRRAEMREEAIRDAVKNSQSRDVDLERQPTYDLRDSELQTLRDLGTFRAVNFDDLVRYRYQGNSEAAWRDLNRLARAGLVRRQILLRKHAEQYALTRAGHQAVASRHDKDSQQIFYHGFVKPREAEHDAAIYRLYQRAADDIARAGGRVTRVVLDFELKRSINRRLAKGSNLAPDEHERKKQEIAEEHGLKVINGRIAIPDLRLEYDGPEHEPARVDLEVVTGHYRGRTLAAKSAAGFTLYASETDRVRLRAAMTDPEIMQEIFSL